MALLLCDLDDTLVSRRATFASWAAGYLVELGEPSGDLNWFVEADDHGLRPRHEFFQAIIDRYQLSECLESMADRYRRDYLSLFRCEVEVITALARAREAGYRVAIVTNGDVPSQQRKISVSGLADLVDCWCISEAEGFWKPDRELFEIATKRCGETVDGAWMIGDNPVADMGGAQACGMRSVWMRLGREWPRHLHYRPTFEADSFLESIDVVLLSS